MNNDLNKQLNEERLLEEIKQITLEFARYGYRRVDRELRRRNFKIDNQFVNHKKVLEVMRDNNLLCKHKKRFVNTTDSEHNLPVYQNLIKELIQQDRINRLNQVWVADITYVRLLRGFVYLSVIIDLFSRKIIGFSLRDDLTEELALEALNMAINRRGITKQRTEADELIHHSDRGVQYASKIYIKTLTDLNIKISMSRKGNPYDNAYAESFMKTLKWEEVNLNEYETPAEAKQNIAKFIEDVYNAKRLHSSLGYQTPNEFEEAVLTALSVTH